MSSQWASLCTPHYKSKLQGFRRVTRHTSVSIHALNFGQNKSCKTTGLLHHLSCAWVGFFQWRGKTEACSPRKSTTGKCWWCLQLLHVSVAASCWAYSTQWLFCFLPLLFNCEFASLDYSEWIPLPFEGDKINEKRIIIQGSSTWEGWELAAEFQKGGRWELVHLACWCCEAACTDRICWAVRSFVSVGTHSSASFFWELWGIVWKILWELRESCLMLVSCREWMLLPIRYFQCFLPSQFYLGIFSLLVNTLLEAARCRFSQFRELRFWV